ncbi:MAG: carboxy-S-adenosyl-L-methionine synthase CmoA [Gammaproteobacteria bacterium]|nr:carboxy-S-adenosyl-L-methionine synthase CmoA [Gammaproteobacteria bacterium]
MNPDKPQDTLYSQPLEAITDFVFDESVVRVFRDMIGRSVPGYSTLLSMIPVIMRKHGQHDSRAYDLGCSLGASTLAMRHGISHAKMDIVAVDNSVAMIETCAKNIAQDSSPVPVSLHCEDIRQTHISNASVVVMNFTLQFVAREDRLSLVKKIYDGLNPSGVFLLSEKISLAPDQQEWMTELHHEFKKANGYSELEISQKRSALENVLVPESIIEHEQRLREAGFSRVMPWFQCFNFVSLLAIK